MRGASPGPRSGCTSSSPGYRPLSRLWNGTGLGPVHPHPPEVSLTPAGRVFLPRARETLGSDAAFAATGLEREIRLEVADIGTAPDYIRQGLGMGFLSEFLITDPEGLKVLQVADCDMQWQLRVATLAERLRA